MDDILELYCMAYNAKKPLICMDEQPVQLIKETREPISNIAGSRAKYDYEYERGGTAVNFMFTEPLGRWRKVNVRERRTSKDWAEEIKELVEVDYAAAEKIILVCDNLNTHKIASLYEAFNPEQARGLAKRIEIHYTPKHGSWLNIAEIELSALTRQCQNRRIGNVEKLRKETKAWVKERNSMQKTVNWQFKTDDARIKLKRLYPVF